MIPRAMAWLVDAGQAAHGRIAVWCAGALLLTGVGAAAEGEAAAGLVASVPLAARSAPRGATMFTTMPAAETGVVTENRYADPRIWTERYHEFSVGAIGTGVTIGDYDGDGRPDLFVVGKTDGCRLFRNLGGWKFEDVTARAGVGDAGRAALEWKQGAAFADIDNDGRLDLYVCRFAAPNLLYVNQGDGTFREEAAARGLALVDASGMAAFCDYDRDGWLDVYVQTNILNKVAQPDGQPDRLYRNNGDGYFSDVTQRAGIAGRTQGHSAIWWDYDHDGWPDLYVANDFAPRDSLYRNNRDGTFTNRIDDVVPHVPFSAMGADLGDVNNDGLMDLFVADMARTTHEREMRTQAETRASARDDGENPGRAPQYLRNTLYLNTGTGRCLEAAFLAGLAATDWTWSPRFEDLDNDGRLDLHITNGMVREYDSVDLRTRAMAAENPAERVRVMMASPPLNDTNLAFRNRGDLQFESVGPAWGLDHAGVSFGSACADFDDDGDLDLVYTNYQEGVRLLRNDSATGHRLTVHLRGTRSNRFGVGATVRLESASGLQVRQLVLARGYLSSSEPMLHFGLGSDDGIHRLTVTWPSGHVQLFTDLAVDRRLTITEPGGPARAEVAAELSLEEHPWFEDVTRQAGFNFAAREAIVDELTREPLLSRRLDRRGPSLAVADLDGDGRDDVVIGGTALDPARLLRGMPDGRFAPGADEVFGGPAAVSHGPVLCFDANGDGANDVLITSGGVAAFPNDPAYQTHLYLNDGHGSFRLAPEPVLPQMRIAAGAVAAADFNRDGRLDLFIGGRVVPGEYSVAPRSALLMNRDGAFDDVAGTLAPGLQDVGMVTAALWTDVDDDGWIDLLVALDWGGVRYWRNREGVAFDDRSDEAGFAAAGTGWWTSLAAADFNHDGHMDYVAGNLGLNTPYQASAEHPALLFHGDFGGRAGPDLIEGYYEGDRLLPWRTRRQLGARIRTVGTRFRTADSYARATLEEIVGADRLGAARRLAATEFRSGVFLSQNDGRFRFEPLPRMAQISPLQGIAAGDFDGDGHADIYAVQNSFAPIAAVGRFDGGLSQLLRGDGRGGFAAVPPRESNLVVPGDAKALAVVDLDADGAPDFLISRNNQTSLAYRNAGMGAQSMVRVSLHGSSGNSNGIGARVVLTVADGISQTAEITAGSGYYSQSSAAVFFGGASAVGATRIQVRWPSGRITYHDAPPHEKNVVLREVPAM